MQFEDQERLLDEASAVVKEQAYYMKRAIDGDNLKDALKHSSNMICELRTSLLSPQNYYMLYMMVFQELQHLALFFADKSRHGKKMADLYDSVQQAANILPRLYLLVTVGGAYIQALEAPAKEVLIDMSELCKGVQHPTRGLFLRYYLSQMTKDKLPDTGSPYEANDGGTIYDAFDFILRNFSESCRLWCRLQTQGMQKDKAKREKERESLRVLVGANLERLAQLTGLTWEFYRTHALPKLLQQVEDSKDAMAQQYLLDCIIQVFPDDFHLFTLDDILMACTKVQAAVDLKQILCRLMKRISDFLMRQRQERDAKKQKQKEENRHSAASGAVEGEGLDVHAADEANIIDDNRPSHERGPSDLSSEAGPMNKNFDPESIDIFNMFRTHMDKIVERPTTDVASHCELLQHFLTFTVNLYPDRLHYVDIILQSTVTMLLRHLGYEQDDAFGGAQSLKKLEGAGVENVIELLAAPMGHLKMTVFTLDNYLALLGVLSHASRKEVSLKLIEIIVEEDIKIEADDDLRRFLTVIEPLIKDSEDGPRADTMAEDTVFHAEQLQVCRVIHQIYHPSTDAMMELYKTARSFFGHGGPQRMKFTLPTLVSGVLNMVPLAVQHEQALLGGVNEEGEPIPPPEHIAPLETPPKKMFQFVHKTLESALNDNAPEEAITLWLKSAGCGNGIDESYGPIVNEFIVQALGVYEEHLNDSKQQYRALSMIVGTMINLGVLAEEEYEQIAAKVTKYGAGLLKKPMQCKAVNICSHLWWNSKRQNPQRVLDCVQKCLKIAEACVQSNPAHCYLFLVTLESYMYYYEAGCAEVHGGFINMILQIVVEHVNALDPAAAGTSEVRFNLRQILKYVAQQQQTAGTYMEVEMHNFQSLAY